MRGLSIASCFFFPSRLFLFFGFVLHGTAFTDLGTIQFFTFFACVSIIRVAYYSVVRTKVGIHRGHRNVLHVLHPWRAPRVLSARAILAHLAVAARLALTVLLALLLGHSCRLRSPTRSIVQCFGFARDGALPSSLPLEFSSRSPLPFTLAWVLFPRSFPAGLT